MDKSRKHVEERTDRTDRTERTERTERKFLVDSALDEIDAVYDKIELGKGSKESVSKWKSWMRQHKIILKELKYKGKIRRLKMPNKMKGEVK